MSEQSVEKGLVEELLPVILAASPGTPTLTCRKIADAVVAYVIPPGVDQ